jgi:hypothetical protein
MEGKMSAKEKFIEDAAKVIDGRVAALKAEMVKHPKSVVTGDRSAILEAEFCARLIRTLLHGTYRGDPFEVARQRWSGGKERA